MLKALKRSLIKDINLGKNGRFNQYPRLSLYYSLLMRGHRQSKAQKNSNHQADLLAARSKSGKYHEPRITDRQTKSKSKPKHTQCSDNKKTSRKKQFNKSGQPTKDKKDLTHEHPARQLEEPIIKKFQATDANQASQTKKSSFWLNEEVMKDQDQLANLLLDYIVQNRIIRDEQYDELFEQIIKRYPASEALVKNTLMQIVAYLDA